MDFNIQLQVTDKELDEFPEQQLTDTTKKIAERGNPQLQSAFTHSPDTRLPIHVRQTLVQSSVHSMYMKQALIQLCVHAN